MPRLRRSTGKRRAPNPFHDSMSEQITHGGAAGVSKTDYDELLCRITADHEHPVMRYVRELPFESPVYPAIEYFRLHPQDDVNGTQEGVQEGLSGISMQEGPEPYRQYITWCMPAHDLTRPDRKGCGFIRSSAGGIVYSACPEDPEHHCKGKRRHCWSLRCPKCMNDTALKRGVQIEKQLLSFLVLSEK